MHFSIEKCSFFTVENRGNALRTKVIWTFSQTSSITRLPVKGSPRSQALFFSSLFAFLRCNLPFYVSKLCFCSSLFAFLSGKWPCEQQPENKKTSKWLTLNSSVFRSQLHRFIFDAVKDMHAMADFFVFENDWNAKCLCGNATLEFSGVAFEPLYVGYFDVFFLAKKHAHVNPPL